MALPTQITNAYWIYHGGLDVIFIDTGKWMLFYPKLLLDSKWIELCNLFDNGKLFGVVSMKCSTSMKNPRSSTSNNDNGVIILYCNYSSNEEEIMNIGKKIVYYIQDYPSYAIYYKTDEQTLVGTKATGATKNYTYMIKIR